MTLYRLVVILCSKAPVQTVFLVVLVLVVFWPVTDCEFLVHDDPGYVYANPRVRTGVSFANTQWAFAELHAGISYWHPLTWLSHQLDCELFGLRPGPHHLTNLWLHALNTVLTVTLLTRLGLGRRLALIVASLFAVHPLHVESVAWVAERKDVLSAGCWLGALHAYVAYRRRGAWRYYAASLAGFALALMSKPTAVTLPLILCLIEYSRVGNLLPLKATWRGWPATAVHGIRLLPYFVMSGCLSAITLVAQKQLGALRGANVSWPERIDHAAVSYVSYLGKVLWPTDLCVSYIQHGPHAPGAVLGAALLVCGVSIGVYYWRLENPWLLFGWGWFLLGLVPVIGLIPVGAQSMADRYMYLPLTGVLLAAVALGLRVKRCTRCGVVRAWTTVGTVGLCALLALAQLRHWRTSVTLFTRAVASDPANWVAHLGLGTALIDERRFDQALAHLEHALRLPGNRFEAHQQLGICLRLKGEDAGALVHFEHALRLRPNSPKAQLLLAGLLAASQASEVRAPARAVELVEAALSTAATASPEEWLIAAAAYGAIGNASRAQVALARAEALARAWDDQELLTQVAQEQAKRQQH